MYVDHGFSFGGDHAFETTDKTMNGRLFNIYVLDEYFGGADYPGAVEIFVECAERMIDGLDDRLINLDISAREGQFDTIVYIAHQLKGSFNTTGSPLLGQLCDLLEMDAREKNKDSCQKKILQIIELSKIFTEELRSFVTKIQKK